MLFQQGDVLMKKVDSFKNQGKKLKDNVLALGEVTGHFHAANGSGVAVFAGEDSDVGGTKLLDAPEGCTVTHQEHGPITLPPGKFEVRIVKEYDHFAEEARQVTD